MKVKGIPFWLVVVMNMNVMIGSGVFINTSTLTQVAGAFGVFSYLAVGLIILPLVLVIAELSRINKAEEGALLTYSRDGIAPWAGILSAASYFVAKAISVGILSRVVAAFYLKSLFISLKDVPLFYIVLAIVLIFGVLNTLGMKFGSRLQLGFIVFKLVPMLFVISFIFSVFDIKLFNPIDFKFSLFASSLPIALYAILGFETCCSISHAIEGGAKRISKAVVTSFILVLSIYTLFQMSLYSKLGNALALSKTPIGKFFESVGSNSFIGNIGSDVVNMFVMLSMLGAYYGMVQANNWNLYAVARELKVNSLTRINGYGIPVWCVAVQGMITILFASSSIGIVTLQRLVVFGVFICYLLSVIALIRFYKTKADKIMLPMPIAYLGVLSCLFIAYNCVKDII